ncbi:sulfatase-like hydrolase/transferase [Halosquirtibacter xylanolyticus]|uniref:sulfatase-like hydrolase/transferase n=1 Tax=Halosquirtibacter xylanolyticus TaxID=3374599 RepID=UPI003748745A|nr:sulfatase-like hydrolase/transferase [Prolixibacteraceae bacterium]
MKQLITLGVMLLITLSSYAKKRPNILFLFADDHCNEEVHAFGNDQIITPNLDQLASQGVTFTNTYNMGAWNGAVCVASRAMMNSGMTVWHAKNNEKSFPQRAEQKMMWAQLLESKGYDTYMTGKWHVKAPVENIFKTTAHERPGMPNQTPAGYNRPLSKDDDNWKPWDTKNGGYWKGGKHWSEVVADDAIGFLDQSKKSKKPFFMYIAFNAPHDPRQAPKEYIDMYDVEKIKIPTSFLPEYPWKDAMKCGKKLRDEKLAPFPRTRYSIKVNRLEYYALITHLDAQIGRIIKELKRTGQDKNTYIIYSADHGLAVGKHGLVGKQSMYEHSMKPPLIVIGPSIPQNEKREQLVYLQDVMATTLDLAKVKKPAYVEFNSLLSICKDKEAPNNYDAIYGSYLNAQRMVRVGDYKLIVYPAAKKVLLYNLKEDPKELYDLSLQEKYQSKVKSLFKELLVQQKNLDDPEDIATIFPELSI